MNKLATKLYLSSHTEKTRQLKKRNSSHTQSCSAIWRCRLSAIATGRYVTDTVSQLAKWECIDQPRPVFCDRLLKEICAASESFGRRVLNSSISNDWGSATCPHFSIRKLNQILMWSQQYFLRSYYLSLYLIPSWMLLYWGEMYWNILAILNKLLNRYVP